MPPARQTTTKSSHRPSALQGRCALQLARRGGASRCVMPTTLAAGRRPAIGQRERSRLAPWDEGLSVARANEAGLVRDDHCLRAVAASRACASTCATCDLTVWTATTSSSAISWFERPRATRRRISASRSVSEATSSARRSPGSSRDAVPLHERARERREDERLARRDDADGLGELLRLDALEHESARAGAQRVEDVVVVLERRDHEHARPRRRALDDAARRLNAVEVRHADVHQDDVGVELGRPPDGLEAVRRLADHVDVGLGREDRAQAAAHEARRRRRSGRARAEACAHAAGRSGSSACSTVAAGRPSRPSSASRRAPAPARARRAGRCRRSCGSGWIDDAGPVLHGQLERVVADCERDGRGRAGGVAHDVRERLLQDAVGLAPDRARHALEVAAAR